MAAVKSKAHISRNGDSHDDDGEIKPIGHMEVKVTPPKMQQIQLRIVGTSPLVQLKFGEKAKNQMIETQMAGSQSKKGKKREPKDFHQCFMEARHISTEGWDGIHAAGFRNGLIDACRLVGFHMTQAKLGIRIIQDGYSVDATPLVRITKGEPKMHIQAVKNATGVADIRPRPMWVPGWEAILTIEFDADMFSATDVINLLARMGMQCGIGEGRANGKKGPGCGWGYFEVKTNM